MIALKSTKSPSLGPLSRSGPSATGVTAPPLTFVPPQLGRIAAPEAESKVLAKPRLTLTRGRALTFSASYEEVGRRFTPGSVSLVTR